ncbi:hypothetical protein ZWY2020_016511 [Hordeum vulgare]|nr:hypothetical protein ZWY2020_016511 [Hordeum vulgare]
MASGALLSRPMGDVVDLVREAKASVTVEYACSMADYLVLHGRPALAAANLFTLTDLRRIGFDRVDFGWGEPVYAGEARSMLWVSSLIAIKNGGGQNVVTVPVALSRLPWSGSRLRSRRWPRFSRQQQPTACATLVKHPTDGERLGRGDDLCHRQAHRPARGGVRKAERCAQEVEFMKDELSSMNALL